MTSARVVPVRPSHDAKLGVPSYLPASPTQFDTPCHAGRNCCFTCGGATAAPRARAQPLLGNAARQLIAGGETSMRGGGGRTVAGVHTTARTASNPAQPGRPRRPLVRSQPGWCQCDAIENA